MNARKLLLALTNLVALLLIGCATPIAQTKLSPTHPASPAAAEAPMPKPSQVLSLDQATIFSSAGNDATASMGHNMADMKHDGGAMKGMQKPTSLPATAATLYNCPMHKEVVSNQPGKCPKCGMKLTAMATTSAPAAATQGTQTGQGHDHGVNK